MDQLLYLGQLAELSIALLGFISIFAIFTRRDGRFSSADKHFIQAMVLDCLVVVLLAIFPRILWNIFDPETTWRVCLIFGVFCGAVLSAYIARDQLRMPADDAQQINVLWHVGAWSLGILAFGFIGAAYFGLITAVAGYVGAASLILLTAMFCFIAIVFRRFF